MSSVIFNNFEDFKQCKGQQLPLGEWFLITQEMINNFANATLDKQWIHVDEKRALKESPFKSTIAHGFMSVAMISKLLGEIFTIKSLKIGLNYGLNKVRFPNPVPVNSQLRMIASVIDVTEINNNGIRVTFSCIVAIKGQEKPACAAEFIAAFFE
ncbi:MaoC family dehydratase [uncultured Polaribacter sp.]|uniref:MaoC family dehydratase n=1 Tax=uncultured Polaribacter sp. TaxID=174711 RepID=UPI0026064243|nr:MaoC family dehydratase [uncultured Polaribacter sp.]